MKNKGISLIALIIMIVLLIVVVGTVTIFLISRKGESNNSNTVISPINNSSVSTNEKNKNTKNTKYSNYTANYPIQDRDLDYYWNINTEEYSSKKFDGKISFFGDIINKKITGKTLKENDYNIVDAPKSYSYSKNFFNNKKIDYTVKSGHIKKNNKEYPDESDVAYTLALPEFINFGNNDDFYSDETEFYYGFKKTVKNDSNIVYPSINGTKFSDLNINLIIEHMGVPTYVAKGDTLIPTVRDNMDTNNVMTFNYYYEYPDYTFVFHFMGSNQKLTGVEYLGKNIFNHSFNDSEVTLKEKLKNAQNEYLKNIK